METERDSQCGHDLTMGGRHAVRVEGLVQYRRGRYLPAGGFLICSDCWSENVNGFMPLSASVNDMLNRYNHGNGNRVSGLYGGYESTGVLPCEGCGLPVERGVNPRMKAHTCSRACTSRVSKAKTVSGAVTEHHCAVCGATLTGRTDRRYCSDRCRQQAHRNRHRPEVSEERLAEMNRKLTEGLEALRAMMRDQ